MTDAGADAAKDRVAAWFDMLRRLDLPAFAATALGSRHEDEARVAARATAQGLAIDAGRGELLASARAEARERVLWLYADGLYRPTMVGLNWGLSEGTAADRAAAVIAAQDAVTATVIEDLADPALVETLAGPFDLIERSDGVGDPADLTRAVAEAMRTPAAARPAWVTIALAAALGGAALAGVAAGIIASAILGVVAVVLVARLVVAR